MESHLDRVPGILNPWKVKTLDKGEWAVLTSLVKEGLFPSEHWQELWLRATGAKTAMLSNKDYYDTLLQMVKD